MQEDFLHYVWQHKKLSSPSLKTTAGDTIIIRSVGQLNTNAGPDFFNSQLKIGGQLWAGNVEIHVKSSDWYVHNHENDSMYDNVILHVVYEHDTEIFRKDNSVIPTLELKKYIHKEVLGNYQKLLSNKTKWINCESDFGNIDNFTFNNWLERVYFERLERKAKTIETLLLNSKNYWEAVLFKLLAKNFGLKVNGEAFLSLATSIDFSILRKVQSNPEQLEALLFGQAGLLIDDVQEIYYLNLKKEYQFLKQKFGLTNAQVVPLQFFRLRPPNFPTIRLSQLAMLYHEHSNLFSKVIATNTKEELYQLFNVSTSLFWEDHYTFRRQSKASKKTITKSFTDLLLINTILPLKFCYAKQRGIDIDEVLMKIAQDIGSEKNSIVDTFGKLRKLTNTSLQSQALIQLKTDYCDKNKCLQCAIGNSLINKS